MIAVLHALTTAVSIVGCFLAAAYLVETIRECGPRIMSALKGEGGWK